jgi:hypothetical protein
MRPGPHVEAQVTRAVKKGSCWFVEGVFKDGGQWRKAAFTMHAPDMERMSDTEFREFARRTLPDVPIEANWSEHMKP